MPFSITDFFEIDKSAFDETNALDTIIDIDSLYFIDPKLVKLCNIKEFSKAENKITEYFSNLMLLLKHSTTKNDDFWLGANKLLTFKEITGNCLGYSEYSTSGNGIGDKLRNKILDTAKSIIDAGEMDPIIFELMGVFQKNIGCDRISDLLTYILHEEIIQYSSRVFNKFDIKKLSYNFNNTSYLLPKNPFNKTPILVLPKAILSPLPIAYCFNDIDWVCRENENARSSINSFIKNSFHRRKKLTKDEIRSLMINSEIFRKSVIHEYKKSDVEEYDFAKDVSGGIIWYPVSKEYVNNYPLALHLPKNPKVENSEIVVTKITSRFKDLIENKGLWRLLYNEDNKETKHEIAAQLLFYGIADSYCSANNLDLSREPNNGRDPVDFKFSNGYHDKILVETKLTSNSQLIHGIETQLPIYMKQEETHRAYYLIINTGNDVKLNKFLTYYNKLSIEMKNKIKLIIVDGKPKKSASTA
ncbi:MAG: hypothetical protein KAQ68_04690 [Clostridiales bacterium]|nr:hypothetical protein [Clostridiales bacterium]